MLARGERGEWFKSGGLIAFAEASGSGLSVCATTAFPLVRESARSTIPSNMGIRESEVAGCWISCKLCSHLWVLSIFAELSRTGDLARAYTSQTTMEQLYALMLIMLRLIVPTPRLLAPNATSSNSMLAKVPNPKAMPKLCCRHETPRYLEKTSRNSTNPH